MIPNQIYIWFPKQCRANSFFNSIKRITRFSATIQSACGDFKQAL